ncbi:MAG: NAD(+)/NADH kinase [Planctomycetes bacterium]|nr:NAD(+)/NADH kinase [Planctomycetota bacterium]
MKRFLLVSSRERPEAVATMAAMQEWLAGRAEVAAAVSEHDTDLSGYQVDAVIGFGGDGTFFSIARRLGENQVPVLGINLGRLGYLAEVSKEEMFAGVTALLEDRVEIAERMMLSCRIIQAGGQEETIHALNDILVHTTTGRMTAIDVEIDGRALAVFRGDGLIVATPTGSTAHSLSAGGPILNPSLRAMVLTPVCTHELAIRPLVVSEQEVIAVKVAADSPAVRLVADGQDLCILNQDMVAEISASPRIFRLAQIENLGRYEILRRKLGWGGRETFPPSGQP